MNLDVETWRLFIWQLIVNKIFIYLNLFHISFEEKEYMVKAGKEGGIKTIIKVMNIHMDNDDVCQNCCISLCVMIKDNRNKMIFIFCSNFKIS